MTEVHYLYADTSIGLWYTTWRTRRYNRKSAAGFSDGLLYMRLKGEIK